MKKPKKSKKQPRAYAFVQDWGLYPDQTMVVVGTKDPEDFFTLFKKFKVRALLAKDYLTWMKAHGLGSEGDNGSFSCVDSENGRMTVLYLKEWPKNASWKNYETLLHELHHAVNFVLVKHRGMGDEWEAQAYAQECLFHAIRRKLDKVDKCKIVYL